MVAFFLWWWGFLVGFAWVFRLKTSFKSVGVDEIPAPPSPFSRGSGWIHRIWFHEMRFHWSWLSAAGKGSFWLSLSSPLYLPGLNHLLLPLVSVLSPFRLLWAVLACHVDQNQTKIFCNILQSCWIKVTQSFDKLQSYQRRYWRYDPKVVRVREQSRETVMRLQSLGAAN